MSTQGEKYHMAIIMTTGIFCHHKELMPNPHIHIYIYIQTDGRTDREKVIVYLDLVFKALQESTQTLKIQILL